MSEIHVARGDGDTFRVQVREPGGRSEHDVTLRDEHRERYAAGASDEDLLRESFRFLLEREPRESILGAFELSVIERYFPEYPGEIRRRLGGR